MSANAIIAELEAGLKGVTPGPWFSDGVKSDGSYGSGDDLHEGYDAFAVYSEAVSYYGKPASICDTHNSDVGEIQEEFDENGHSAWDEQARENMAHIARCSPENIRAICNAHSDLLARIAALETALTPFVALINASDALSVAGVRKQQPEASKSMADEEIAEMVNPSSSSMLTDGAMAFGHSGPRPERVTVTVGDFRRARAALSAIRSR